MKDSCRMSVYWHAAKVNESGLIHRLHVLPQLHCHAQKCWILLSSPTSPALFLSIRLLYSVKIPAVPSPWPHRGGLWLLPFPLNAQKANSSRVVFPPRIRSSSTGSLDFSTLKPTQTAEVSMRAERGARGAVNQHWCCERPALSFQSTEWVRKLPGWFVAWLLLSISLEITAGGGPAAWKRTRLYQRSSLSGKGEKQALGSLPRGSDTLTGNFAASGALYDDPGSSSAPIRATKVHLCFSISMIFFFFLNNAISAANYTFHMAHYSLPPVTGVLKPDTLH